MSVASNYIDFLMTTYTVDYQGSHVTTQVVNGYTCVTTRKLVKMITFSFQWRPIYTGQNINQNPQPIPA